MDPWLPSAEHDMTSPNGSGAWTREPSIALLHKTQGNGIAGAIATLHSRKAEPHFVTEIRAPKGRRNVQMVRMDRAAKALRNESGGVQTNKAGVIQWEIVGYSEVPNEADYTEADWLWFGKECIKPVLDGWGIPHRALAFHDYPPEGGVRLGSEPWRMSDAEWMAFEGICGHQHAPENVHGDPGNLSRKIYRNRTVSAIDLILEGAGTVPTPPDPEDWLVDAKQELLAAIEGAKPIALRVEDGDEKGNVFVTDGLTKWHVPNREVLNGLYVLRLIRLDDGNEPKKIAWKYLAPIPVAATAPPA